MTAKHRISTCSLTFAALLLASPVILHAAEPGQAEPGPAGFARRGFYLHGSWVMDYPFAVRGWEQRDFAKMFRMLRHLRFNTVMVWPTPEAAPMPLSQEDAQALRKYRAVIDEAHRAGLECWLTYCPSVIAGDDVRSTPWSERSLYASMKTIRLDDQQQASAYLEHRSTIVKLLDNADAIVVIDGDPGGYPGAPVAEYLRILKSDQQAAPEKLVIPWIWSGWGRDHTKGGYWTQPVAPYAEATYAALNREMTGQWEVMPGRSHRAGWANGRVNVQLAEQSGLLPRSTFMCYEAIEFEPSPPAAVLQFDHIRRMLQEEGPFAGVARGVFGNAQQPVMVLPNLYFFGRGAADLSYLDQSDTEILTDLAHELGGDPAVLVPAWSCLSLTLDEVPAELADRVRRLQLTSDFASTIPGGSTRYVEILAAQVASRRELLAATAQTPREPADAARSLARGAAALLKWWQVHHYVGMGRKGDPFQWGFVPGSQVEILRSHARKCVDCGPEVLPLAADELAESGLLPPAQARARLGELVP